MTVQRELEQFFKENDDADAKYGGSWGSKADDDDDFWGSAIRERPVVNKKYKPRDRSRSPVRRYR